MNFLPKPFAFDELVKRMEKLVRDSLTERLSAQPKTGLKTTPVATPQPLRPSWQRQIHQCLLAGR